jgi:L-ascorbate metabolism protein UlaG (beta-lactamase superfamily)
MTDKTKFEFFGNAAYRITNREGKVILIDPFLNDSDCSPIRVKDLDRVDLLLVTHAAWDHMGDTLEIAKKFECPVVCGGEVPWCTTVAWTRKTCGRCAGACKWWKPGFGCAR